MMSCARCRPRFIDKA